LLRNPAVKFLQASAHVHLVSRSCSLFGLAAASAFNHHQAEAPCRHC